MSDYDFEIDEKEFIEEFEKNYKNTKSITDIKIDMNKLNQIETKLNQINIKKTKDNSFRREELLLLITYLSNWETILIKDIIVFLKKIDFTSNLKISIYSDNCIKSLIKSKIICSENYEKEKSRKEFSLRLNEDYIISLLYNQLKTIKINSIPLNSVTLEEYFQKEYTPIANSYEDKIIALNTAQKKYNVNKTENLKQELEEKERVLSKRFDRIRKETKKLIDSPFHNRYKLSEIIIGIYDCQERWYRENIKLLLINIYENKNMLEFIKEIFIIYIKIIYNEVYYRTIRKEDNFRFQNLIHYFIISVGEAYNNHNNNNKTNFSNTIKKQSIKYKVKFKSNLFLNSAKDYYLFNKMNKNLFNINTIFNEKYFFKNSTYDMFQKISKRNLKKL